MRKKLIIGIVIISISICIAIVVLFCFDGNDKLEDGVVAWKKGDYEEAVQLLRPYAERGNNHAKEILATLYAYGHGVVRDRTRAISLLSEVNEAGLAASCYFIAEDFRNGSHGVDKNDKEAIWWYTKAADLGDERAQSLLATAYREGKYGVGVDEGKSQYWSEMLKRNQEKKAN